MRIMISMIIGLFLLNGCATTGKDTPGKEAKKKPKIYKVDFENDGLKETVQLEDKAITGGDAIITILNKKKEEIDKLSVEDFQDLELIDLDNNGHKQIVIYTKDDANYSNLTIYSLKNGRLNEIFSIGSPMGLDTNFKACIPRIKAGIPKHEGQAISLTYEVWVWSGYKFIKDHNE